MRTPNFFIVGAPRCGTTSMWRYLKGHPDIFMSAEKELYFFDSDLWKNGKKAPPLAEYLNYFSGAVNQKRVGEATPSYLRSRLAAKEIKAFSPGAQIIIMLRNPLDVMHSLHSSALDGPESITDFETALKADAGRTGSERIGYREFTDFPVQVQRYCDLFGHENVHTIIYDELRVNSASVCQSVLRFLGVCLDFAADFPWIQSNEQVRNWRLQKILVRPPGSLRNMGRTVVPQPLRSQIRRLLLKANRVMKPRPPMDLTLKRRLQREFEPKIEQLSRMLGRDLSAWCDELHPESKFKELIQT